MSQLGAELDSCSATGPGTGTAVQPRQVESEDRARTDTARSITPDA